MKKNLPEVFAHLEKYVEAGRLRILQYADCAQEFRIYLSGLDWAGSWIDWNIYKHVEIKFDEVNFIDRASELLPSRLSKIVFTFVDVCPPMFPEPDLAFVCESRFGLDILDEVYWRFAPHQYGYFVGDGMLEKLAEPEYFFETDVMNTMRIKI